MNEPDRIEEMLRDSLDRQAGRGAGIGPDLDEVLGRAHTIRRHRRQGVAALAAAAIVAITVPTTLYLHSTTDAGGSITPTHPGTPTIGIQSTPPSPSSIPSTPGPSTSTPTSRFPTLVSIPRAADTTVTYLDLKGLVHSPGTTTLLPGGDTSGIQTFHDFRGGWVTYDDNTVKVSWYDASGKLVEQGKGSGDIAVSSDRTQIAWQVADTVYYGSTNTMGNGGPTSGAAPKQAGLVGFLAGGPAFADGNTLFTLKPGTGTTFSGQDIGMVTTTTSQAADLVGGITGTPAKNDQQGAVYDLKTHRQLWANSWRPMAFSDDGRYVAAAPIGDNGDPSTYAILDARTGRVVAQMPQLGAGNYLDIGVAWQGESIVFEASGGKATQSALLSLSPTGAFTRVSDVVAGPAGRYGFRFAAQP